VGGDVRTLRRLQQDVEEAMNRLGYAPEERDFSPHLTLARVERNARPGDVEAVGKRCNARSWARSLACAWSMSI